MNLPHSPTVTRLLLVRSEELVSDRHSAERWPSASLPPSRYELQEIRFFSLVMEHAEAKAQEALMARPIISIVSVVR